MIDAYASLAHYLRHLAPVWSALDPELRGHFYVRRGLGGLARSLGVAAQDPPRARRRGPTGPLLVAGWADGRHHARSRPLALVEHGAGQSYADVADPSYAGGGGWRPGTLFLTPREEVADRWRARYRDEATAAVVGSPYLDLVAAASVAPPGSHRSTAVAVTFHWRSVACPEARSSVDYWWPAVEALVGSGVEVIGHAHPRIASELEAAWGRLGVPFIGDPFELVRHAGVLVGDNTSALYEWAALDRPVVVLDAPHYRRDVEHGLRFWAEADVGVRIGDGAPASLAGAIERAREDPPEVAERRRAIVERVYPIRGDAAERAAAAIETWASTIR